MKPPANIAAAGKARAVIRRSPIQRPFRCPAFHAAGRRSTAGWGGFSRSASVGQWAFNALCRRCSTRQVPKCYVCFPPIADIKGKRHPRAMRARTLRSVGIVITALALGSCFTPTPVPVSPARTSAGVHPAERQLAPGASKLVRSDGVAVGIVQVTSWPQSVAIGISAYGLVPGVHRLSVHAVGRCTRPSFESAGPQWSHGDLGLKTVGADGRLYLTTLLYSAKLRPSDAGNFPIIMDEDGASVVIHSTTGPPGSTRDAIACAVIRTAD